MEKNVGRIFSAAIALSVILGVIIYGGKLLRQTSNDTLVRQVESFHSLPENSLDVIVYGSSRAWRNVNTVEMQDAYGMRAYNYGSSWQHLNTTALYIHDSYLTQTPKVAFVETSMVDRLLPEEDMEAEVLATLPIRNSVYKRAFLRQCFGNDLSLYLAYYIPFISFHSNWTGLTRTSFLDNGSPKDFIETRGYHDLSVTEDPKVLSVTLPEYSELEQYEISPASIEVLDEILYTCRSHGTQVVFFTAPYRDGYHYGEAMQSYADRNGCLYFDMFARLEEAGIDPATDFWDTGHLNYSGATKLGHYLGSKIS